MIRESDEAELDHIEEEVFDVVFDALDIPRDIHGSDRITAKTRTITPSDWKLLLDPLFDTFDIPISEEQAEEMTSIADIVKFVNSDFGRLRQRTEITEVRNKIISIAPDFATQSQMVLSAYSDLYAQVSSDLLSAESRKSRKSAMAFASICIVVFGLGIQPTSGNLAGFRFSTDQIDALFLLLPIALVYFAATFAALLSLDLRLWRSGIESRKAVVLRVTAEFKETHERVQSFESEYINGLAKSIGESYSQITDRITAMGNFAKDAGIQPNLLSMSHSFVGEYDSKERIEFLERFAHATISYQIFYAWEVLQLMRDARSATFELALSNKLPGQSLMNLLSHKGARLQRIIDLLVPYLLVLGGMTAFIVRPIL